MPLLRGALLDPLAVVGTGLRCFSMVWRLGAVGGVWASGFAPGARPVDRSAVLWLLNRLQFLVLCEPAAQPPHPMGKGGRGFRASSRDALGGGGEEGLNGCCRVVAKAVTGGWKSGWKAVAGGYKAVGGPLKAGGSRWQGPPSPHVEGGGGRTPIKHGPAPCCVVRSQDGRRGRRPEGVV